MYRLGKLLLIGVMVGLAMAPATEARAQEKPRPVTVKIDGIPADVREVATLGANGQKHTGTATGVAGEFTFPGNDFNDGKTVEIWEVICDDGTKIVVLDPSSPLPPGCRKSKKIGEGIWAPGARLTAAFPQATSGLTFRPYASGGFGVTYFGGSSGVCKTIDARYLAALYDSSTCDHSGTDFGWNFGAGSQIRFGDSPFGVDVGFNYMSQGAATVDTSGDRTNGNLHYQLTSELELRRISVRGGPILPICQGTTLVPYVSIERWTARRSYVDALLAGTPQQQVNGHSEADDLTKWGWGAGARLLRYLDQRNDKLAVWTDVFFASTKGPAGAIFGTGAPAPWPTNQYQVTASAGVTLSLGDYRIR